MTRFCAAEMLRTPDQVDERNEFSYFHCLDPGSDMRTAAQYVTHLASNGRYHFSTDEVSKALGISPVAARAALRRLATKEVIASPERGFHVFVPPEYRRLGCLPPEQFIPQLMAARGLPYYAGLLSAAQYHGAAHQRPQHFQVMVGRSRPALVCGAVQVTFIARGAVANAAVELRNTPRGVLRVSSPEVTALDLVGYPAHAGGLDLAATVVAELAEKIDPGRLVQAARGAPLPWAQRLGYVLDLVGAAGTADPLALFVRERAREYVPLATGARHGQKRSAR